MKYNFYHGLLGYGVKGSSGQVGLPGTSIYFSDYDMVFNRALIETYIQNNFILLSSYPPNSILPNNKQYMIGDLIIDNRGDIWEIGEGNVYFKTDGKITKTSFFDSFFIKNSNNYERWFNKINENNSYIIDNVKSNNVNKLKTYQNFYNINKFNFTRIEYTDVSIADIYPFSYYSNKFNNLITAIKDNKFLFNCNNLTFDVSNAIINRNVFIENEGEILTLNELDSISLFSNFNEESETFSSYLSNGESISIQWDLDEFTTDTEIKASLYFSKNLDTAYDTIDITNCSQLIFNNIERQGNITISDLEEDENYVYFIKFEKNGWERNSKKINAINSDATYRILVLDPFDKTLEANYLGVFNENGILHTTYEMDIDASVQGNWNISSESNWISFSQTTGISGVHQIDVSLSTYSGQLPRTGVIKIESFGSQTQYITVKQNHAIHVAQFNNNGNLIFTPALTDQVVNISLKLYSYARAKRDTLSPNLTSDTISKVTRNSNTQTICSAQAKTVNTNFVEDENTKTFLLSNITASDNVIVDVHGMQDDGVQTNGPDCQYTNNNTWMEGLGYIEITAVSKVSGTGNILPGISRIWYSKRIKNLCNLEEGAISYIPSI